ncbi:MAG TPA: hypothetical protein VNJ08_07330 [Bacteriovoracaceae bacterium]|nr:hypothetical protein [Bacteriovoracaceae bacterium]
MRTITLLLLLLTISACSGHKESVPATLQVTRGFAIADGGFGGGLTITGTHIDTNRKFSISVINGAVVNLNLDKGSWQISAVGWDGANPLEGIPYCGSIYRNLTTENATIDLAVTKTQCGEKYFAGSHVDTTASPPTFKKMAFVNSCKSFFKAGAQSSSMPVNFLFDSATPNNYCDTDLPLDLRTEIHGIRISTLNKQLHDPDLSTGIKSACLSSPGGSINVSGLRLPSHNIPMFIETFKDTACTRPFASYPFLDGLIQGNPDNYDHLLFDKTASEVQLWLPGVENRRAKSVFTHLMPAIECHDGSTYKACATAPSTSPAFHMLKGTESFFMKGIHSCTPISYGGSVTNATCQVKDGGVLIDLTATPGSGSFTLNGTTYVVYNADQTDPFLETRWASQKNFIELVGSSSPASAVPLTFFGHDENQNAGALHMARFIFSADGAGSLFPVNNDATFYDQCMAITGEHKVENLNLETMQMETHLLSISDSPRSVPGNYFCDITNKDQNNCKGAVSSYDKRMVIYDYSQSQFLPTIVMEFNCEKQLGRIESFDDIISGDRNFKKAEIVTWNTQRDGFAASQRLEQIFTLEEKTFSGGKWDTTRLSRKSARVEKYCPAYQSLWSYSFDTKLLPDTNWKQSLESNQLLTEYGGGSAVNVCLTTKKSGRDDVTMIALPVDPLLNSFRSDPPSISPTMKFKVDDPFPQSISSACSVNYMAIPANNDKIDGNLNFDLNSLYDTNFANKFGTVFFQP